MAEFDLGFISHAHCDTTVNHDVVRSMLFSGMWSKRLTKIHVFLANNLKVYSSDCCAIYPPQNLFLPANTSSDTNLDVTYKSYVANLTVPADQDENMVMADSTSVGKLPPPPGSVSSPYILADKAVTSPSDTEVTVQFYQPTLEENDPQKPEAFGPESRILLLFALYKKTGPVNQPGVQWVSLSQLNDLHDR